MVHQCKTCVEGPLAHHHITHVRTAAGSKAADAVDIAAEAMIAVVATAATIMKEVEVEVIVVIEEEDISRTTIEDMTATISKMIKKETEEDTEEIITIARAQEEAEMMMVEEDHNHGEVVIKMKGVMDIEIATINEPKQIN